MGEYLLKFLNLLLLTHLTNAFCDLGRFISQKQLSIEETTRMFPIVFRGISLATTGASSDTFGDGVQFTARFELSNMFKDAPDLRNHWSIDADYGNRKLDVVLEPQLFEDCRIGVTGPIEYIIFGSLDDNKVIAKSIIKWDEQAEQRIWMFLGWSKWSEWSPCSVSCSSGIQQRIRHCSTGKCPGYNIEQRHCNLFGCASTINPLVLEDEQYFHPTKDRWKSAPDRKSAWKLESYIYLWVPSMVLLASMNLTQFPMQFSLFFTVRIHSESLVASKNQAKFLGIIVDHELRWSDHIDHDTSGTLFSLRSRTLPDTYLSIDLRRTDIKVAHATENSSNTLIIPTNLADSHWHQIAISIRNQNVVECYVDCEWATTNVLKSAILDLSGDADVIIGYMFEGDLEQVSIVTDPDMVNLHCSTSKMTISDPSMEKT